MYLKGIIYCFVVNYLGVVCDLTIPGIARVSMSGYVEDILKESGTVGSARTPATEGLFDVRENAEAATEEQRVRFQACEARLSHSSCIPSNDGGKV